MEKKNQGTSQGNEAKASTSAQMIFGANMLQINGDDASGLIGSIIEKGISENLQNKLLAPTPPPKVTVLPFPVARHRSHGPHWGPMRSEIAVNDDNEDDEDNDSTEINSMSAFANPVQMRQKKGLDLSQWRGLIPSDSPLESSKMEGNRLKLKSTGKQNKDGVVDNKDKKNISWHPPLVDKTPMEVDADQDLSSFVPPTKKGAMSSDIDTGSLTPAADMEIHNSHQVHVEENIRNASSILSKSKSRSIENMPNNGIAKLTQLEKKEKVDPAFGEMLIKRGQKASTMVSSSSLSNFGKERGSLSLESEIDTENRARLKGMSPEEIAEAQAEIMEKMDPALVNLLKKRGQEKLKQQYISRSDKPISNELNNTLSEIQTAKSSEISSHVRSDSSDMMTITTSTDTKIGPDNGLVQDSGPHDGYLWNSWSERVEAVRRLRFSLEGSVITDESEAGKIRGFVAFVITGKGLFPTPKKPLNPHAKDQGSSGSVMELEGVQSITIGVFSPAREAINTDSWIKDEDEQKFEEKISGSLKHFNSQSDGNNDQDPTLNLNSSMRDGCHKEESFGIQNDMGINSAVKNIEVLKSILLGPRLVKIFGNKKVVPLVENVLV
ncbi:hypothetical protein GH714_003487 [Hevea brasiliensis]|uniref:RPAP1 N-terminal domain-containing protein n=1 Tax=Hevea brasiliensis TaxID=3981 RepID=A0A6A6KII8_HEVBR|nr:hypothetical protein GH714_003487 [Hevea brasiliensis]